MSIAIKITRQTCVKWHIYLYVEMCCAACDVFCTRTELAGRFDFMSTYSILPLGKFTFRIPITGTERADKKSNSNAKPHVKLKHLSGRHIRCIKPSIMLAIGFDIPFHPNKNRSKHNNRAEISVWFEQQAGKLPALRLCHVRYLIN